ncbi:MAG: glycosyl hydrolase 115 family protein [Bacteroidales bacterium]|nr:glycosyl hydrolase 115 family protein [Bacteroidales bacterium]
MKKIYRNLLLALAVSVSTQTWATEQFVTFGRSAKTAIELTHSSDTIAFDPSDWEGVRMAVENLRQDLQAVTGSSRAPIVVATVGKSALAKKYKKECKLLKGKWEQYLIFNDGNQLVILGSDKRGTIYGIYELSRQMGVSPWYWMADAPIQQHERLFVNGGTYTDGEPKVKYRGIFINDEWPSFGTWCNNQFGGINSKAYSRIFELLLRLKANYFWPAMWDSAFNEDDTDSPRLADAMGIVMGTSHHEPMMRAHKEYTRRRDEVGPWDYAKNPDRIEKFFTEGIEKAKNYENIVTIGMRGDGDVAMGSGNDADNIKTLNKVIAKQREIIQKVMGKKPQEVPQLWAIFTEVQRYYDAGMTVPDDVTLLFCDNNWGYIRRMGGEREKGRKGGMGMYYHIDMNGGPWNDRWVNTTTVPKLREQLNLAYQSGIDRIWIINVGDLKPKEMPIDFIMNYAWNPDAIQPGDEQKYLEGFAASIFGQEYAQEVADIMHLQGKYNLWRKPEVQYPGIFNHEEMLRLNGMWQHLVTRCENLQAKLPKEAQDAFYQLVYYPTVGSAGIAHIYNYATLGDSLAIEALMEKDRRLTDYYNNVLADGKWRGMMLDNHIGYTMWSIPEQNRNPLTLGFEVKHNLNPGPSSEYSIPAHQYNNKVEGKEAGWIFLPGLGRSKGCMGSSNVLAASDTTGHGAALEYEINMEHSTLAIGILPVQDVHPARGMRLGVQIDNGPVQIIDARQGFHDEFREYTPQNLASSKVHKALPPHNNLLLSGWYNGRKLPRRDEVFDNLRWLEVKTSAQPGKHTLRVVMIDPEIVVEQIVVNPDNNHYSYFGN